ncbi:hypothetical protein BMF94_0440 [Rhodotorula taiwanensis]|uniref:Proteophosphoglycan ppg4 n=1 Tax=Rhodotorula taiwanensis TaxID=741276 RepID=A0A2S5BHL2_9BASI|nr:hypothetical protein BMF94_0440 [Rhodotorula taiwanensis]
MSRVQTEPVSPRPCARTPRERPPHGEGDPEARYRAAFPDRMSRVSPSKSFTTSLQRAQGPAVDEVHDEFLRNDYRPLPLTASDNSIDELEEMLLSSTLNKLRSFGSTSSSHEQRGRRQFDWYGSTHGDRTSLIYSAYDPSAMFSPVPDARKLQSGPTRRGYSSLMAHTSASAPTRNSNASTDQPGELDAPTSPSMGAGSGRARRLEAGRRRSLHEPERGQPSQASAFTDTFRRTDNPSSSWALHRSVGHTTREKNPVLQEDERPVTPVTPLEPLAPLAPPDSSPLSGHSPSLNLTINTSLDSSGHRVLASRRRHSAPSSPVKCRKIKTAFGVGDDGPGQKEQLHSASLTSFRTNDGDEKQAHAQLNRRQIDPGESLWERPISTSTNAREASSLGAEQAHLLKRRLSRHVPIDTFTPPPPLDVHSPGRLAALASLGRSGTLAAPTSPASPYASSGSISRRLSLGRRPTLKRFSLPNSPVLPPLSPTFAPERFATVTVSPSETWGARSTPAGSLERNSSHGSACTLESTSTASMPPTPQDPSPLLPRSELFDSAFFGASGDPATLVRPRAPVVTFDLPSDRVIEPQKPSEGAPSYFSRDAARSHRRTASAAAALEAASEYGPFSACLERDYAPLIVTNPDRPDSAVSFAIAHSPVEIGLAF